MCSLAILRHGAGWREEKRVGSDPQLFVPHTFLLLADGSSRAVAPLKLSNSGLCTVDFMTLIKVRTTFLDYEGRRVLFIGILE